MFSKDFRYYSFKITGIIFIVFLLQFIPGFEDLFILDSSRALEIWRYITAIFLHGGIAHLLYNSLALVFFGSVLERIVGSKRFLLIYFVSGILANIVSINFYSFSLGASGAIFGVIGALVILRPLQPVLAFGLPMPMVVAGIAWALGDIVGAAAFISGNPINNTGNIAHLSGMFFGVIFGFLFKKKKAKKQKIEFDENLVRRWEDNWN